MYDKILRRMRKAARAGRVRFTDHATDEMGNEDLTRDDVVNGILTGEIIEDQFDIKYQDTKYVAGVNAPRLPQPSRRITSCAMCNGG
jgi:hypothetical protein